METMTGTASAEDLRAIRQAGEAARGAPLLGGRFLLFWGALVSAAWAGQWAILSGAAGLGTAWLGALWLAFSVAAAVGMVLLTRSLRGKPGRGAMGNVVEAAVWSGAGFALFAYAGATIVSGSLGLVEQGAFDTILAVAFALYGTAFLATAAAARQPWLKLFAALSFTGAGIVPFLVGDPLVYLVSAVIVFVVAAVPGFVLLSREPAALTDEA